ncbi:MAG: 4'-phosphopantetheinyl transferase superfamily protein [Microscillaceae bacterium]|nr:4'-phosphopantetheinyl transferase superfamily protein [Microscillaceae bacterium]
MPLIHLREINPYSCWGLWHITESVQELITLLDSPDFCLDFLDKISHPEKQKESLAARLAAKYILQHWQIKYPGIQKDQFDKPSICKLPFHVSLSHALDYSIAIIHQLQPTGIDMEQVRDKILRIAHKFLSDEEAAFTQSDLHKLTLVWVVKEAVYKLYGAKKISFSKNIRLSPFEVENEGIIQTRLILDDGSEKIYPVHYLKFKNYYLAYAF